MRKRGDYAAQRNVVETTLEKLARDPLLFLHPEEAGCAECDEARRSTAH